MATKILELFVGATYHFEYTNHRGNVEMRTATFEDYQIYNEAVHGYYPAGTHCFLMIAHDRGDAKRSFAVKNINFDTWRKV